MDLYYANGGGLGHLTRANAFLRQLKIENETAILTASKFADDKRIVGDIKIIKIEESFSDAKEKYKNFLQKVFADLSPEKIYLDSFPAGIIGEFEDFNFGNTKAFYIARLLKWKKYARILKGKPIHFKKTYILEKLGKEHQTFINNHSEQTIDFDLHYPLSEKSNDEIIQKIIEEHTPFWLIVHSGNFEEINELMGFAEEMHRIESAKADLILISPDQVQNESCFDIYPASKLFPFAGRIITACGFNSIQQAKNFRHKHFFLPFERRYDDQFQRAKILKSPVINSSK